MAAVEQGMETATEILQSEARLACAMLAGDVVQLEALLAEGLIFTNHDGRLLSKADDLAAHRSGRLRLERLEIKEGPLVHVLGDCAVVRTVVELGGRNSGQLFAVTAAYTRVWYRDGGTWRIEAAHCSILA